VIRDRLLVLLAAPDDVISADFDSALRVEAGRALSRLEDFDPQCRIAVRVPPSGTEPATAYDLILQRGLANGVMLGGFSAVVEVSCSVPNDEQTKHALAHCVAGLGERLGSLIERQRSTAIFGTDLVIIDGGGPLQLFYCMRRADGTTHEAFSEFWAEQHTKIAKWTPGLAGYRQMHADIARSRVAAKSAGLAITEIDGVALEWFKTMDDFAGAVGGPAEFRESAKASELRFNSLDGASAIVASVSFSSRGLSDASF
jgi:hypothetical protein